MKGLADCAILSPMSSLSPFSNLMSGVFGVLIDILTLLRLIFPSPGALAAENLFLRKQLGLYVERKQKPRRASNAMRFTMAQLSRFFEWRDALTIVKPDTLIRWHRKGFRLFWKWKSRASGRPRVPADVRRLIVEMATNNPTWGEERIANELSLKIGIRISPRTVRQYMPKDPKRPTVPSQRWMTFVRNHAKAIIASDFFIVVTATFRVAYVPPEFQRQGIGSKLIRDGLERCRQAGYDAVVVLGDPAYYSRFGFVRAADFGLQNEYGVADEFMVLPLHETALEGVSGMVKYLPEFREAEC